MFEISSLHSDVGPYEISVLFTEEGHPTMATLSDGEDLFYDNPLFLRDTLLPALERFIYHKDESEYFDDSVFPRAFKDRMEIYELLLVAKHKGWLV